MNEHNQADANGIDQFITELIGDRAQSMNPELLATEKEAIASQLNDALIMAVLNRLSDEAQIEIEQHTDDDPSLLVQLVLDKAKEANLDLDAITLDTMAQFKAFYTGEVLPEEFDDDDDADGNVEGAE
jgi:hypothetical protein